MSLRNKLQNNIFHLVNLLTSRVAQVEHALNLMQERFDRDMAIQRNHMMRLKNGEKLSDAFIMSGKAYRDLDPQTAWTLFQEENFDFIFLDVSHKDFKLDNPRPAETLHIPLEELQERVEEIKNKTTPLFIISEDGLRSILACDFLSAQGHYNCNNVSGGWCFWPGHQISHLKSAESA